MGLKRLQINLSDSTLSTLKKRAVAQGRSSSECARELVESGLEVVSGPNAIDSEGLRRIVAETVVALRGVSPEKEVNRIPGELSEEETNRILTEELGLNLKELGISESQSSEGKFDAIKFLLEKLVKYVELPGVTTGEREDWLRVSGRMAGSSENT